MCSQMNEDLQGLLQFCQGNKLKLHPEKFQCMLITTSKRRQQQLLTSRPNCVITVNGNPLQYQETMKHLGVKIDHILKFYSHIEYVKNKVAKKVGFLQRIRNSLSPWTRQVVGIQHYK
jgi:tetraacyldisaccharide-1-P 4'-kinase